MNVCVIGGGPVGCAAAVVLRRLGYTVDIFERYHDIRFVKPPSGRSINLVLTRRGLRLAEDLGIAAELMAHTVEINGRMIHDLDGSTSYQPYGRTGECNYSIDRLVLNKFWLNQALKEGCRVFFDHTVSSLDVNTGVAHFIHDEGRSQSSVHLSNYSVAFASDGAGSVVRGALHAADLVTTSDSLLCAGYKEMVFPSNPDGSYSMDPHSLHIWARKEHMVMALANTDGSFTGTLFMDRTSSDQDSLQSVSSSIESAKQFLETQYPSAMKLMNQTDCVSNLVTFKEGVLGTVRCSPWAAQIGDQATPICLIGDASHAIVPFFGQGVNCGFEDVFVLKQHLLSRHHPLSFESLRNYSIARKKDTDAIADLALENFEEMRSRVADESFLQMKKLDQKIMESFPNLYRTRYTLIMYTYNPYSVCKEIGDIQSKFLQELLDQFGDELPPNLETLLREQISPHIQRLAIEL